MKIKLILLLSFIYSFSYGQHRQRLAMSDLDRIGLNGSVKSLTHIDYRPIEAGDTSSLKIDHFFLVPNNYTMHFNEKRFLSKKIEYEYLWMLDSLKSKGIWYYNYDSLNRIINELYIWNNRSKDTTRWVYEYFGDTLTIVHKYDDTYKQMTYRYAQKGNIEWLTTVNSDSSYLTRQLFSYDKQNRMIRREEYEDKATITFIRSWQYSDSLAKKPKLDVAISAKSNYGPIIIINEYDSLANLTVSKGLHPNSTKKSEYILDNNSNWIERRTILPTKLIKISKRTIEYYDQ